MAVGDQSSDSLAQTPSMSRRSKGGSGIRLNKYRYSSNSLTREQRRQRLLDEASALTAGMGGTAGDDEAAPVTPKNAKHRFEITRRLGSGTYGKVSLAYDHKMEREVAVKLIKKSAIENKQDLLRIRREIRIMSALQHPFIIQIYEVFENREKIIIIMEYSSKGELYDYVSQHGSLSEADSRRLFRQITSAVLYCHRHGVVHRDLKLENILLDKDGFAKIADFGLSNYFSPNKKLSTFCGSPLYASPEIINGTPYKGPEVDCWSLGVLLYTLVYGSMPFDGRDFNRMVRQIKRGAYYEPDTPSTASMLIRNMLRVNPEKRASIDEIASHWWLNLDENLPMILELPENQVIDPTPLNEREQTMVVQDLCDETDVFMEFGHISESTRKKIEEFRRRRKEAEQYLVDCPIGPKKGKVAQEWNLAAVTSVDDDAEKPTEEPKAPTNVQTVAVEMAEPAVPAVDAEREKSPSLLDDPLQRLRNLEQRLNDAVGTASSYRAERSRPRRQTQVEEEVAAEPVDAQPFTRTAVNRPLTIAVKPPAAEEPPASPSPFSAASSSRREAPPSFVGLSDTTATGSSKPRWKMESDMLNLHMNQLLEQTEKGQISMNLVNRIKACPGYYTRPLVKELLEAILLAQHPICDEPPTPSVVVPAEPQPQSSKMVDDDAPVIEKIIQKEMVVIPIEPPSPSPEESMDAVTEVLGDGKAMVTPIERDGSEEEEEEEEVDTSDFEELESELDDSSVNEVPKVITKTAVGALTTTAETKSLQPMAAVVEADHDDDNESFKSADSPGPDVDVLPSNYPHPPDPSTPASAPPYYITRESVDDSGLIRRLSRGKYMCHTDVYHRGFSLDESQRQKRRIGGVQPEPKDAPKLFEKAKEYILEYPNVPDPTDVVKEASPFSRKMNWLKTQDPDLNASSSQDGGTPRDDRSVSHEPTKAGEYDSKTLTKEDTDATPVAEQQPFVLQEPPKGSTRTADGALMPIQSPFVDSNRGRPASPPQVFTFNKAEKSPDAGAAVSESAVRRRIREKRKRNRTLGEETEPPTSPRADESALNALISPRHLPTSSSGESASRRKSSGGDLDQSRLSYTSAMERGGVVENQPTTPLLKEQTRTQNSSSSSARGETSPTSVSPTASGSKFDPFYSYYAKYGGRYQPGSALAYVRPRYNDETYRAGANDVTTNGAPSSRLALNQRRKSRSLHELSPEYGSDFTTDPVSAVERHETPTTTSSTFNRYPVYQPRYTSAARTNAAITTTTAADREPPYSHRYLDTGHSDYPSYRQHTTSAYGGRDYDYGGESTDTSTGHYYGAGASAYRNYYHPTSLYDPSGYNNHRPLGATSSAATNYYRSRYDADNVVYRRGHYDVETAEETAQRYTSGGAHAPPPNSHQTRLKAGEQRRWMRSQSLDKKFSVRDDTGSFDGGDKTDIGRTRTPDIPPADYGYVAYHDTSSNAIGRHHATPHEPPDSGSQPAKSILKKFMGKETGSTANSIVAQRYADAAKNEQRRRSPSRFKPMQFVDKIRRHLSTEKVDHQPTAGGGGRYYSSAYGYSSSSGYGSGGSNSTNTDGQQGGEMLDKNARKKRSLLNLTRRRTVEVGGGGGESPRSTAGGYTDRPSVDVGAYERDLTPSRRPSSPLEKIKGFFRKSRENVSGSGGSRYSSISTGSGERPVTTTTYTPSNLYGLSSYKKAYEPVPSSTYHRPLSYVPVSRRWYDEPSLY